MRYWSYTPGVDAENWEEDLRDGVMRVDLSLGCDLNGLTREEIKERLNSEGFNYKTVGGAPTELYKFANEMEPGDIVYATKGMRNLLGRGEVTSGYRFDEDRESYRHRRDVKWTDYVHLSSPIDIGSQVQQIRGTLINISSTLE